MGLLAMMDELLRNREALYQTAWEGRNLRTLSLRLLLLFLLTTALYGAVMGAFRTIHPAYFFSDFELTAATITAVRGEVAGITPETGTIYTHTQLPKLAPGMTVRFNCTDPSEAFAVQAIGTEKGYNKLVLAEGAVLKENSGWVQPAIVALKIPLLFLLTLAVCSLALYILNLAVGMRLHFGPAMLLMLFALAGTGVLLAVFAPIALLFTIVTTSYHFMKIMHVLLFAIAGLFGVKILGEGLAALQETPGDAPRTAADAKKVSMVLFSWLLLYCLVGAQMAWTLKPFLGTPYLPATPPFRLERGNIFVSTFESMQGIRPADRAEAEGYE